MKLTELIYSFRARLSLVLAALLMLTLGVQYSLNLQAERDSADIRERQERALRAGFALGVISISSQERLIVMRRNANDPLLNEQTGRVANIVIVADDLRVTDSLDPDHILDPDADGTYKYRYLQDIAATLPPLTNADELVDNRIRTLMTATAPAKSQRQSHVIPVDTEDGRWHVIVVLKSDREPASIWNRQAARPLVYTLIVLLVAIFLTAMLVWRFTQPITDLSDAARRVAAGDFNFRVPAADRRDEMGALATVFNEMIANLGRTRELEVQLRQAEQSAVVGRLASAIAHEVRNPLNYINLTLDHLRTTLAPEDENKRGTFNRLANQLKAEVARINTRISEFLNYTRPSKLELRPLDLRAAVEDAMRLVEVQAAENNIKISVETKGEVPLIMGDAESLRSVFTNLIINGMHAIDGDGGSLTITLSSDAASDRAQIEVTDTGRGITPEDLPKVFEPYFSTKETGTGLGLAIVKKAVGDHGGTISVKSKSGVGTTFTVTLPTETKG